MYFCNSRFLDIIAASGINMHGFTHEIFLWYSSRIQYPTMAAMGAIRAKCIMLQLFESMLMLYKGAPTESCIFCLTIEFAMTTIC
jgi:hypothetical protein